MGAGQLAAVSSIMIGVAGSNPLATAAKSGWGKVTGAEKKPKKLTWQQYFQMRRHGWLKQARNRHQKVERNQGSRRCKGHMGTNA